MRNLLVLILGLFFVQDATSQENLAEFSTSMGFEEFEIILTHLEVIDTNLANEISAKISNFKTSSRPEQSKEFDLKSVPGYLYLAREDEYAFVIAVFTSQEAITNIEKAYEQGINDLGI